jgi:hypothetical protein
MSESHRTDEALVESGGMVATVLAGHLREAITSDTFLRTIVALGTTSLLVGTFAGTVVSSVR